MARITALDVARALAFLGMVQVNFTVAMSFGKDSPGWMHALTEGLTGRAASLFVVLAGVGLSPAPATTRPPCNCDAWW